MEQLRNILFFDIETVPLTGDYAALSEGMQYHWMRKAKYLKTEPPGVVEPALLFQERAGVFAEFGKVVCIGFGCLVEREGGWKLLLKSITGADEKDLLVRFCQTLSRFEERMKDLRLCGHNIKEFDVPFLCRRMVIHGMVIPPCMFFQGRKPWEVPHLDTLELWRFGDHKHYTSLDLLAEILGIPSPKADMDGSMVGTVYWKEMDLERISAYCLQDVQTTAKVFLRLKGIHDIAPEVQLIAE